MLVLNGAYFAHAHTVCAYLAFLAALAVGVYLHYEQIVENSVCGYPDEWFPLVLATIGDWYPERLVFQILIALTATPRFTFLGLLFWRLFRAERSAAAWTFLVAGVVRLFTAGGWVYITLSDDHDAHDVFMIAYIVLTIPYDVAVVRASVDPLTKKLRVASALAFFGTLVPLVYWFIQHKVHERKGAYSVYAYFEWALILLDVLFDVWAYRDLLDVQVTVGTAGVGVATTEKGQRTVKKKVLRTKVASTAIAAAPASPCSLLFASAVHSFFFFTLVTGLFVCVWHFPLWYMGISGYEALIVALTVPAVLGLPSVRALAASHLEAIRSASIIFGVGAYRIETPEYRLLLVAAGAGLSGLAMALEVSELDTASVLVYGAGSVLGLLVLAVVKYAWYTLNPIWPIMHDGNGGWNVTGVAVGLIAARYSAVSAKPATADAVVPTGSLATATTAAFSVGALFYSLSAMLTDGLTIVYFGWEGYPAGPLPTTHLVVVFGAVAVGILLSLTSIPTHPLFSVAGAAGGAALYALTDYASLAGGVVYAVYLAGVTPAVLRKAHATNRPGLVFGLGGLVQVAILLAHVFIVAYAFVPGGVFFREHYDYVLGVLTVLVALGAVSAPPLSAGIPRLLVPALVSVLAISGGLTYWHTAVPEIVPFNQESRSFTAGIWTIHFGLDNDMWALDYRMAELLKDAQVDIVGLLETDTQRLIGGNRDLTQSIAAEVGYYADYGPGPQKHTWGACLLSKFPILNSTHHLLPLPVGELAPAIHATLDVYGELVDVFVFHSGQEEDEEDRRLQLLEMQRLMALLLRPKILLLYLVTEPLVGNYNTYVGKGLTMYDIDSTDDDRWCEYILFRDLEKVGWARILRSSITDTELQIAKFRLVEEPARFGERLYENRFVDEETVDEGLRFPECFRGDGIRDHRYHVFDEPRYFEPVE